MPTSRSQENGRDRLRPADAWPARTHGAAQVPADAPHVVLLGRLTQLADGAGALADETGEISFHCGGAVRQATAGDVVAVIGEMRNQALLARDVRVLVQGRGVLSTDSDWARFRRDGGRLRHYLEVRARILTAIRDFFHRAGFLEVETPRLVGGAGNEGHIDFFQAELRLGKQKMSGVLIPSPEHHMKRLLGAGFERIFQVGHCFRNDERSDQHNPEFTMLEWYRAYSDYHAVMEDVEQLLPYVLRAVAGDDGGLQYRGQQVELSGSWPRVTVTEAFARYAGIDLMTCPDAASLQRAAAERGYRSVNADDGWEDAFGKILVERVEPGMKGLGAAFLVDYPLALGALARRKPGAGHLVERAEAYVAGVELANGYSELNDAAEQKERFAREAARRRARGLPAVSVDGHFLNMLECGMPPAAGMALGVDRLTMLCTGTERIDDVIAFPAAGEMST